MTASVSEFLHRDCGICNSCVSLVVVNDYTQNHGRNASLDMESTEDSDEDVVSYSVNEGISEDNDEEKGGNDKDEKKVEIQANPFKKGTGVESVESENESGGGESSSEGEGECTQCCTVCSGLCFPSHLQKEVLPTIVEALQPYCQQRHGGQSNNENECELVIDATAGNHLTRDSPTVNLPWIIGIRAQCAIAAGKWFLQKKREEIQQVLNAVDSLESMDENEDTVEKEKEENALFSKIYPEKAKESMLRIVGIRFRSAMEVYLKIKEIVRSSIREMLDDFVEVPELEGLDEMVDIDSNAIDETRKPVEIDPKRATNDSNDLEGQEKEGTDHSNSEKYEVDRVMLSASMHKEEAGYLGVHILFLPPQILQIRKLNPQHLEGRKDRSVHTKSSGDERNNASPDIDSCPLTFLDVFLPPTFQQYLSSKKDALLKNHSRALNPRKRFRGNDPTLKQGGDPKSNLELRVRRWLDECNPIQNHRGYIEKKGVLSNDRKRKQSALGNDNSNKASCNNTTNDKDQEVSLQEWDIMLSWLEKDVALQWLQNSETEMARRRRNNAVGSNDVNDGKDYLGMMAEWMQQVHQCYQRSFSNETHEQIVSSKPPCTFLNNTSYHCSTFTAAFRRPFYVQGRYTKSRRDVSQTPFYVVASSTGDDSNQVMQTQTMVKKGVSSIEEEVCPPLALIGCGGISERNNCRYPPATERNPIVDTSKGRGKDGEHVELKKGEQGELVYGLTKFHASGREDMNVRMLLPPSSILSTMAVKGQPDGSKRCEEECHLSITARPFVCEMYDVHHLPTERDLKKVVLAINHEAEGSVEPSNGSSNYLKEIVIGDNGWPEAQAEPSRYYGQNPNGVGVSSPLRLVSSHAFSSLQSETEEKVKYYACICWTEQKIVSDEDLIGKLGCLPWNGVDGDEISTSIHKTYRYPLKIDQSTPIRVLHRRSSDIRIRYILDMWATRIDDNWFRLRLSTSAGTYVKEFVHGDCGRTYPSVRSMMGGRTDITELDCEGIAL